jgi:DMSO/TMAO reductase YedYZ molybdopterin-dependent catalytic subunit
MTLQPDVVQAKPRNAETPWAALLAPHTPAEAFFVRNHFDEPHLDAQVWHLRVGIGARRPKAWTLPMLERLPQAEVTCVLECAGNGRSRMVPKPPGVAWGERAVGCATFTGPRLKDVLAPAPPEEGMVEAVFKGADLGIEGGTIAHFERSLPLALAQGEGPIVALRMNGAPLTRSHGAPARLVVPGWYGVASVKWLTDVRYVDRPFKGYFQSQRYVWDDGAIVQHLRPRAMLLRPHPGEPLAEGDVLLEGRAWAGRGVAKVAVQVDDGPWQDAALGEAEGPHAWVPWRLRARLDEGPRRIRARAWSVDGEAQPLEPVVNQLGYGNNTVLAVDLLIGPPQR